MDYNELYALSGKVLAAEAQDKRYSYWLDQIKKGIKIVGSCEIGFEGRGRSSMRVWLTEEEIYKIIFDRMNVANAAFIKARIEFTEKFSQTITKDDNSTNTTQST